MARQRLIVAAALAAATAAALAGDSRGSHPRMDKDQARPNVVVIMTDDQTVESLRVMKHVRELVGAHGTTFASSFSTYALCCPSRATFLTGQYAHTNGIMGNRPPEGGYDKLEATHANTLPGWLSRAGYYTAHIGKYLNGYTADDGVPAGWREWHGAVDPSTYRFYGYTLNENGALVTYGFRPEDYQADVYTRKAVDVIRRRAPHGPFLLSVAYLAPHSGAPSEPDDPSERATPVPAPRHRNAFDAEPMPKPPSFNEQDVTDKPSFIRRRPPLGTEITAAVEENYQQRLESLLAIDEGVAAIVRALQRSGELANTLIVFTSDNGFFHGEHRVVAGKVLLYEPSIRVPLILRGPGVPRGRVSTQLVGNIDLAPTIVDVAHAHAGRHMDGGSLLDVLRPRATGWRTALIVENQRSRGVRTARFLYAEHDTGERELYDLARDPHQLTNLAADPAYASTQAELTRTLATLLRPRANAGPRLALDVDTKRGRSSCWRFPIRVRLEGDVHLVRSVEFVAGPRRVHDQSRPFEAVFVLPRTRPHRVRANAALADGRSATARAIVPACPPDPPVQRND